MCVCVCACRLPASYERTTALLSPRSRIKIQTGTSSCLETEKTWYNTGTAARLFVLSPGDDNVQPKRRGRANQEFLKWCNFISEEQQTEISPRRRFLVSDENRLSFLYIFHGLIITIKLQLWQFAALATLINLKHRSAALTHVPLLPLVVVSVVNIQPRRHFSLRTREKNNEVRSEPRRYSALRVWTSAKCVCVLHLQPG